MTIRQSRYILAETEQEKKVRVTEVQRAEEDPFIRRSDIQQQVNNSTLPVSSRAVNLAIESINNGLDLKADKSELDGLATEDYVNEKIDEKEIGITEAELISKSVGSGKWIRQTELDKKWDIQETVGDSNGKVMREGAGNILSSIIRTISINDNEFYKGLKVGEHYFINNNSLHNPTSGWFLMSVLSARSSYREFNILTKSLSTGNLYHGMTDADGIPEWRLIYDNKNTSTDRNGVLHAGAETPLDTLNTSDMADTVVDNDLLTVTSGAVFRAIKQLTDQIISLEARVRELEDGGV